MKLLPFLFAMAVMTPLLSNAAIKTETIEYKQGDATLQGYLAYDDTITGKVPGVLVVHDWFGMGDYVKMRAEQLAKLGYVAFAADIYGKDVHADNPKDAGAQAGKYKGDRALFRARLTAGLDELKKNSHVDLTRIAAIGYCFGGTGVLELARSGADIAGVVSFHGGLDNPNPADAKNIRCKVLVLHGADDKYEPADQIATFQDELRKAGVDWQMIYYSGAVHAFTRKDAGNDNSKGVAYNEKADKRSWQAMKDFFTEIFGESPRAGNQ